MDHSYNRGSGPVPGKRSHRNLTQAAPAWVKYRFNKSGEFVIGGFMPGPHGVDSIILGQYEGKELMYVGRVRAGFVPASRRELHGRLEPLVIEMCPFANLPERGKSRWGETLNAEKIKKCVWLKPKLTAEVEFLERAEGSGLRHAKFVGLIGHLS